MADDASYQSFLSKANEPLSSQQQESTSTSSSRNKFDPTKTAGLDAAPEPIAKLLSGGAAAPTYTSDTDAEFEPFFASYSGKSLPSAEGFAKSLGGAAAKGQVEVLSVEEWDRRGEYKEVVEAVRDSGDGGDGEEVKVYRLEVSSTRAVYFVVTLGERGGKLVGVKVESVES